MENDVEMRIYSVLREDLPMSRAKAMALHSSGYVALSRAIDEHRANTGQDLARAYHPRIQPKLVLRTKGEKDFTSAREALTREGIPHVVTSDETGQAIAIHIVPTRRDALPKEVTKLQLFSNLKAELPSNDCAHRVPLGFHGTPVSAIIGDFPEVPLGKMLAQAGHAVWTPVSLLTSVRSIEFLTVPHQDLKTIMSGEKEELSPIIDAGRTIFGEPTTTAGWTVAPLSQELTGDRVEIVKASHAAAQFAQSRPSVNLISAGSASGATIVLAEDYMEAFMSRWPASGLEPEAIEFSFDTMGNLIDMDSEQDGPAMLALSHDAQAICIAMGKMPEQVTMTDEDVRDTLTEILNHRREYLDEKMIGCIEKTLDAPARVSRTAP